MAPDLHRYAMSDAKSPQLALVVDDDPIYRYAIARLIRSYGWATQEAAGGAEALRLCRELSPQIVFLDLQMPDKDGFETLADLRSDGSSAAGLIVAVSGLPRHSVEERALRSGFDLYLLKPVSENLLRHILAGAISAATR